MTTPRKLRPRGVAREDILTAATRLFADRGYADVTLREIAQKAKVHLPAIYKSFQSKRALYVQCCINVFAKATIEIARKVSGAASDQEKVLAFTRELARLHIHRPIISKLAQRCVLDGDRDLVRLIMQGAGEAYHAQVLNALWRMIGEDRAYRVFFAISALIFGASQLGEFRFGHAGEPDPSNVDQLTAFALESLIPQFDWSGLMRGELAAA